MKKLTNFFKENLTHKILPFLSLFLLVFNLFFVSEVKANFDIILVDGRTISYPDLPNIPNGSMPVCAIYKPTPGWYSFFYSTVEGSYFKIYKEDSNYYYFKCYDSSGNEISFNFCGRATADSFGGWADVGSGYQDGIYKPFFDTGEFWALGTILNKDGSIFYTSNSQLDEHPYIDNDIEDIEYFLNGFIIVEPRKL